MKARKRRSNGLFDAIYLYVKNIYVFFLVYACSSVILGLNHYAHSIHVLVDPVEDLWWTP